jgi:hypothetical protein
LTVAAQAPPDALTVTFAGHVTVGSMSSVTVTVKVQVPVLPDPSVAVHVTVVVPTGKLVPDAGTHMTVASPVQASFADGVW